VGDLTADRAQQRPALAELALDRGLGRVPLCDDLHLLGVGVLEELLPVLHLAPEASDLTQHERVLLRHPLGGIHAADHVVEALGSEKHGEPRILVAGRVDVDEPVRKLRLRVPEALPRRTQGDRVL
jgi:hypothetical protein